MLHNRPRKAKKFNSNQIQHSPKYVKCKTKQKKHWPGFCVCKRNSLLCHLLADLWKKWCWETLGEQTAFFMEQELLKWKLLPWIIYSTQGIISCHLYILSTVYLCWGTNQKTQPGLPPGHVSYFREDEGALFSWLIITLMLVHHLYFCSLEFVGLTQTHWGRLGLISKLKWM